MRYRSMFMHIHGGGFKTLNANFKRQLGNFTREVGKFAEGGVK